MKSTLFYFEILTSAHVYDTIEPYFRELFGYREKM